MAHRYQSPRAGALRARHDPSRRWRSPAGGMAGVGITHESRADGHMTAPSHESSTPDPRPRIRVLVNPSSGAKAGIPTNTAAEDEVRAVMESYFPDLGA